MVVSRIRVQIDDVLVSKLDTGAAGGYCLGTSQRASCGTARCFVKPSY
jgi:hypothetical protein